MRTYKIVAPAESVIKRRVTYKSYTSYVTCVTYTFFFQQGKVLQFEHGMQGFESRTGF